MLLVRCGTLTFDKEVLIFDVNAFVFSLLLWDCDNRSYSYYIETSYDNINWSKAVDKQTVACRSVLMY